MKIHLVDGTYELFRAHFGAPPKKAPDGREVGETPGLLRSLLLLLSDPEVTHVAVAFDHVIELFRNKIYATVGTIHYRTYSLGFLQFRQASDSHHSVIHQFCL